MSNGPSVKHTRVAALLTLAMLGLAGPRADAQIRWRTGVSEASGMARAQIAETITAAGVRGQAHHLVVQFQSPLTRQERRDLVIILQKLVQANSLTQLPID